MSPDDEVQVTLTRAEVMRIEAALTAMVAFAHMAVDHGLDSALGLAETGALEAVEGALPKLRAHFPEGYGTEEATEYVGVGADAKSYNEANVFEVKVDDLEGLTPQQAAAVFATEYDESIRALLSTLERYTDFSHEQFHQLLADTKDLLTQTMPVPSGLALKDSLPYVSVSDLTTLGALAHEMYKRQDQVEANLPKPF